MAVKNEHINVIRYLLNNGAAVDEIVTVLEGNILHFAAAECTKLSVFQLFFNRKSSINCWPPAAGCELRAAKAG